MPIVAPKKGSRLFTGSSLEEKFLLVNERIVRGKRDANPSGYTIDLKKYVNNYFGKNQKYMDKCFEAVEKRFVFMQWLIMVGFVTLGNSGFYHQNIRVRNAIQGSKKRPRMLRGARNIRDP